MMSPAQKERILEAASIGIWHEGDGKPWGTSCTELGKKGMCWCPLLALSTCCPPSPPAPGGGVQTAPTHLTSGRMVSLPSRRPQKESRRPEEREVRCLSLLLLWLWFGFKTLPLSHSSEHVTLSAWPFSLVLASTPSRTSQAGVGTAHLYCQPWVSCSLLHSPEPCSHHYRSSF